jgi:hypothetical protein
MSFFLRNMIGGEDNALKGQAFEEGERKAAHYFYQCDHSKRVKVLKP